MSLEDIIPTLQMSIGPVILISGIGLLLLTMTNRFGRVIDRARQLAHELRSGNYSKKHKENIAAQIQILQRRARIARLAVAFAGLSVLLVPLLNIDLFLIALFSLQFVWSVTALFAGCMVCLIASLIFFIADINISLTALDIEVDEIDDSEAGERV